MAATVRYLPSAAEDLVGIASYIERQSSATMAAIMVERILAAVDSLRDLPLSGHVIAEWDDIELREVPSYNYRVLYRFRDDTVTVIGVIHGARQLPDSLRDRLPD